MVLARAVAVVTSVWIGFVVLIDRWRGIEASVVVAALRLLGVHAASRIGDQIVVHRPNGTVFLANIEPLCSSLGIVLLFGAMAAFAVAGARRRRARAFALGACVIVVCNLVRIGATVSVGLWKGPGTLEVFHDGLATGFAVLFVLVGCAVFAFSLPVNATRVWRPRARPPLAPR